MPSARYLMTLTPEEREPFLEAAVADAQPLYEADRRKPEAERELTADLETGDFHEYTLESSVVGGVINFASYEIDILFDAVEGYTPLWDARWEVGRSPALPETAWVRLAQAAIEKLLAHGLIMLFWDASDGIPREVASSQVSELLRRDDFWFSSAYESGTPLCFAATPKGEEVFRTNEQIKTYYQGGEFASRYPDPEWHPMKRSDHALQDRRHTP